MIFSPRFGHPSKQWLPVIALALIAALPVWAAKAPPIPQKPTYHYSYAFRGAQLYVTEDDRPNAYQGKQGLLSENMLMVRYQPEHQVLAVEWEKIVVTTAQVFAQKDRDGKFYSIPLEKTKRGWKAGKPVPTPYFNVEELDPANGRNHPDPVVIGLRERLPDDTVILDLIDERLQVIKTLERVHTNLGFPALRRLGTKRIAVEFVGEGGAVVLGVLDRAGNFLGPPIANPQYFYLQDRLNLAAQGFYVAPLDAEMKRFLPLRRDGTFVVETRPIKGYYSVNVMDQPKYVQAWLKEYDEEGASTWGWVASDLSQETGPLWRTVTPYGIGSGRYYLNQLKDGRWMGYYPTQTPATEGAFMWTFEPMWTEPVTTEQAAKEEVIKAFAARAEAARRQDAATAAKEAAEEEERKKRYLMASDLTNDPETLAKAKELDGAIYRKDWPEARVIAEGLGGDYWTRFVLTRSTYPGYGPVSAQYWYQLAEQTQNPRLRAEAEARGKERAAGDARAAAESYALQKLAIGQAQRREAEDRAGAKAWLLAGGGLTMSLQQKPTEAERSRSADRYYQEMDKYMRGQQTWEPAKPKGMDGK